MGKFIHRKIFLPLDLAYFKLYNLKNASNLPKTLLLLYLFFVLISCKKENSGYLDPKDDPTINKVEMYITPVKDGKPATAEKYLYTSQTFDSERNIVQSIRRLNTNIDLQRNPLYTMDFIYQNKEMIEVTETYMNLYKERTKMSKGYDIERWSYNVNGLYQRITTDFKLGVLQKSEMYVYVDGKEHYYSKGLLNGSKFEWQLQTSDPYILSTVLANTKLRIDPNSYYPSDYAGANFPNTAKDKYNLPSKGEFYLLKKDNQLEFAGWTEYVYYR